MALTKTDVAAIAAIVAEAVAQAIASAPAQATAAARTKPVVSFTKSHACTAAEPCSRTDLRTAKRAATHGVDAGGHVAK